MSENQPIVGDLCSELRQERKNSTPYEDLDRKYSMDIEEIICHVTGNCDCQGVTVSSIDSRNDEPWRERYVVKKLYRERQKRFTEMADILDCHSETAKKYVDEFDISPIDSSNRTSSPRVNKLQRMGKEQNGDIDIKNSE